MKNILKLVLIGVLIYFVFQFFHINIYSTLGLIIAIILILLLI